MDPGTVAIGVAAISALGNGWQYLISRRSAKEKRELERHQVEAQAYDKARAHYDAIIDDLTSHINWLKSELGEKNEENTRLKERILALEKTIEMLRTANVIVIESPRIGDK